MLYRLEHFHETYGYSQKIYIGLFDSIEIIDCAINQLILQPGFNLHPRSCFKITEIVIDDYYWKKGFYTKGDNDIQIE